MRFKGEIALFTRFLQELTDPLMSQRSFLVTGAFNGVGRACSERLADADHHVSGVGCGIDDTRLPSKPVSIDQGAPSHLANINAIFSCVDRSLRWVFDLMETCRVVVVQLT